MSDTQVNLIKAGLEDAVVSTSEICFIDGHRGRLLYRGYDVDDLVAQSTFEEVIYLLWHGRLPTRKELMAHEKVLSATATRTSGSACTSLKTGVSSECMAEFTAFRRSGRLSVSTATRSNVSILIAS